MTVPDQILEARHGAEVAHDHPAAATVGDLGMVGERIEALLDASASGGVVARERAEELVRLVTDLYGSGIERILDILHRSGRLDDDLLDDLAGDELVSGLLIVHGLHPYGVEDRVERALADVRPYLGSHGGDVELLEVSEEGVVRLRLLGSCDGCPSSSVTLELAVEGAIAAAAPEVTGIEIQTPGKQPTSGVISVDSLFTRLQTTSGHDARAGWQVLPALADLDPGEVRVVEAGGAALVGCRVGAELYVFHDRCARCSASLAGSSLARRLGGAADDALLTCGSCGSHYDVRGAGACVEDADLHLGPLPVLVDASQVSVALRATEPV